MNCRWITSTGYCDTVQSALQRLVMQQDNDPKHTASQQQDSFSNKTRLSERLNDMKDKLVFYFKHMVFVKALDLDHNRITFYDKCRKPLHTKMLFCHWWNMLVTAGQVKISTADPFNH